MTEIHTCSYQCDRPACIRAQRDELAARAEAQAQGGGEVVAWETEDGRFISARQKAAALRYGGAVASSVAPYTTPLYRTAPPSAPVGVEVLIAKWRSEAAQLESVGDDNALAKAYAQRLDADELEGALGQQSGAVAPTTAECPHDWGQDEAHEDWARCYKCGISRRKPLAQQPAAVDGVMELVRDIAEQKPEKPDYWSSCSQCESNIDRAQEVLATQHQEPTT